MGLIVFTRHEESQIKTYKCRAKAKCANSRFEDRIDYIDVYNCLKRYSFKCFYCGQTLHSTSWQLDHFYSRSMGGKNKAENLVCTCKWCNQMKHALDGHSFIYRCQTIVDNNKIKELFNDNYLPQFESYFSKKNL